MISVDAHFDGRFIVPDGSLEFPLNQTLIVPVGEAAETTGESALGWLAANAFTSDALPADLACRHDHYLYGYPAKVG